MSTHVCVNVKAFVCLNFICLGLVRANGITTQEKTLSLNLHDIQWPAYFMGHLRNNTFQSKLCATVSGAVTFDLHCHLNVMACLGQVLSLHKR